MPKKFKHTPAVLPSLGAPYTSFSHTNQIFDDWYETLHSPILPENDVADQPDEEILAPPFVDGHRGPSPMIPAAMEIAAKDAAQRAKDLESEVVRETVAATKSLSKPEPVNKAKAKLARRKALRKKPLKKVPKVSSIVEGLEESLSSSEDEILNFNDPVIPNPPKDAPGKSQPNSKPVPWSGPPSPPRPVNKDSPAARELEAFRSKLRSGGNFGPPIPSYKTSWPSSEKKSDLDGPVQSPKVKRLCRKQHDIVPSFEGLVEVIDRSVLPSLEDLLEMVGAEQIDEQPATQETKPTGPTRLDVLRKKLEDGAQFNLVHALDTGYIPSEEKMEIVDTSLPKNNKAIDEIKSTAKKDAKRAGSLRVAKNADEDSVPTASELNRRIAWKAIAESKSGSGVKPKAKSKSQTKFKAKANAKRNRRTQLELLLEAAGPNPQKKMRTRREQYYSNILDLLMDREAGYESDDE